MAENRVARRGRDFLNGGSMNAIANAILAVEQWRRDTDFADFFVWHVFLNVMAIAIASVLTMLWTAIAISGLEKATWGDLGWRWYVLSAVAVGVRYFPRVWKKLVRWANSPQRVQKALRGHPTAR